MDEMSADLSSLLQLQKEDHSLSVPPENVCVYGEQQTTSGKKNVLSDDSRMQNLYQVAAAALLIRRCILDETGYTVTMGVSVNPVLAKLACSVKKPGRVNILPPPDSTATRSFLNSLPLRKIPTMGRSTAKALVPCLRKHHNRDSTLWTCGDLLDVPQTEVVECLRNVRSFENSSTERCGVLLDKCRGVDNSPIVDDHGGLPKTVSVENSFRRGTVKTRERVQQVMDDLYERLPRLLEDRAAWSDHPEKAYPATLRLTVRSVTEKDVLQKGRRGVLRREQVPFDGKSLLQAANDSEKAIFVRQSVSPLLQSLILSYNSIHVTRINIAVTNFQDLPSASPIGQSMMSLAFASPLGVAAQNKKRTAMWTKNGTSTSSLAKQYSPLPEKIDPCMLAELPPDIAAEVLRGPSLPKKSPKRSKRIDEYFVKK
jgi:nucleotidyltransferase/DNA polymerase involved in DNA repair